MPQELRDPLPSGLGPVLRALASTTRDRHRDLIDIVEGLPDEALAWSLAPDAPAIAGLVLHIVDVEAHLARSGRRRTPIHPAPTSIGAERGLISGTFAGLGC